MSAAAAACLASCREWIRWIPSTRWKVITNISQRRTIYRAIISQDHDTALHKGYYNRAAWEKLLQNQVATIAKEMGIDERSMEWVASYHHKRGNPHVHLMYWDDSNKVRKEYISKQRFEITTERIKAAFNRELFQGEIKEAQAQQKVERDSVKLELQALFRDMNLAEALNLNQMKPAQLDVIGEQLKQLFLETPKSGRLAYQFLSPAYKSQLQSFMDEILKIRDFKQLHERLIRLTDDVGIYYGNSADRKAYNREKARERLYADMGNQILRYLKETRKELAADIFGEGSEDKADLQRMAENLFSQSEPIATQFNDLLAKLPDCDITSEAMPEDKWKEQFKVLSRAIHDDMRIRTAINAYVSEQDVPEDADEKQFRKKLYGSCYFAIDQCLRQRLYQELSRDLFFYRNEPLHSFRQMTDDLLQQSVLIKEQFAELVVRMSDMNLYAHTITEEDFKEAFAELAAAIKEDAHIRTAVSAYVASQAVPEAAAEKQFRKHLYADCYRTIDNHLRQRLYRELGRYVLDWSEPTGNMDKLRSMAKHLLINNVLVKAQYDKLRQKMPEQRTPAMEILQGDFKVQFDLLTKAIRDDIRIQTVMHAYAAAHSVPATENEKAFRRQFYAECYREISKLVMDNLKTDAGYPEQARADMAMSFIMELFRSTSLGVNHQQNQRRYDRFQRDRSKAAQRDYKQQKSQDSGWEME